MCLFYIRRDEFMNVLRMHAKISTKQLTEQDLKCVFHAVDTDHSGEIDFKEFKSVSSFEIVTFTNYDIHFFDNMELYAL